MKLEIDFQEYNGRIFEEYLKYKAHVTRQVYASERDTVNKGLEEFEQEWPEYEPRTHLITSPSYLQATPYDFCEFRNGAARNDVNAEGAAWLRQHLQRDVEQLQMMKQHHVHLRNPETNKREPLAACRAKANPKVCKSHFPRNMWLVAWTIVLCQGC